MATQVVEVRGADGLRIHYFHDDWANFTIDRVENDIVYINKFDLAWEKEEIIRLVLGSGCIVIQRSEED